MPLRLPSVFSETKETILESSTPLEAPVRPRLRSLDTFRG